MQALLQATRPHPGEKVAEVEEVLADACARLAELDVRARDLEGADRAVREGLSHAPEPTYFRGHLLEVQGLTDESRATAQADAGLAAEAAKSRASALAAFAQAVDVQEHVIGRALDDGGATRDEPTLATPLASARPSGDGGHDSGTGTLKGAH